MTWQYNDTLVTTAEWDTVAGEVRLPAFQPFREGGVSARQLCFKVHHAGDYAHVATSGGLEVYDISDPRNPVLGPNVPMFAYDLAIAGNYVYVAAGTSGLKVVDISDPEAPFEDGSYDTDGTAVGVTVHGNYALVADYTHGLQIIDISDPTNPTWAGGVDTDGLARDVAVCDEWALVADDVAGIQTIWIGDPTAPMIWPLTDPYEVIGPAYSITISGNYAFVADGHGLSVIDIHDPFNGLTYAGDYESPGANSYDFTVVGRWGYLADALAGIQVIDISVPTDPTWSNTCDTPDTAMGIDVVGGYAFVADLAGFQAAQVALAVRPPRLAATSADGGNNDVAIFGSYAVLTDRDDGLTVMDISNPVAPNGIGFNPNYDGLQGVCIAEPFAFVADYDYGLRVFSLQDPTTPAHRAHIDLTPDHLLDVAVDGYFAYVVGSAHLHVVSIDYGPTPALAEVATYANGWGGRIVIAGDYAYVLAGDELKAIDISDPEDPWLSTPVQKFDDVFSDVQATLDTAFLTASIFLRSLSRS